MQRFHELRVAADAGKVGDFAARGGDAGLCCVLLERGVSIVNAFRGGGKKRGGVVSLSTRWVRLTAQLGSSVRAPRSKRAPAVAKGAVRRARVEIEYFILASFGFRGFWFVCMALSIKNDILQRKMDFNESVGRSSEVTAVKIVLKRWSSKRRLR